MVESGSWLQGLLHALKTTALDILVIASCLAVALGLEEVKPRRAYLVREYLNSNSSYPHKPNSVPSWSVPLYSVLAPLCVFLIYRAVSGRTSLDVYRLCLNFLTAVFLTGALTNALKVPVGRPRPNFASQCWPNSTAQVLTGPNPALGGYAVCAPDVPLSVQNEIRKSWPSGHSSWSAAGLGYLTLFLLGQLHVFAGGGHIWRLVLALLPSFGAVAVGVTRVTDYWHHPSDVITGLALGFVVSFALYRQYYPALTHAECSVPRFVLMQHKGTEAARKTHSLTILPLGELPA